MCCTESKWHFDYASIHNQILFLFYVLLCCIALCRWAFLSLLCHRSISLSVLECISIFSVIWVPHGRTLSHLTNTRCWNRWQWENVVSRECSYFLPLLNLHRLQCNASINGCHYLDKMNHQLGWDLVRESVGTPWWHPLWSLDEGRVNVFLLEDMREAAEMNENSRWSKSALRLCMSTISAPGGRSIIIVEGFLKDICATRVTGEWNNVREHIDALKIWYQSFDL